MATDARPRTTERPPRNNRSHAEDGAQDIRGMSALRRPERSGDRKTSGGRLFCNDRSGDLGPMGACSTTTGAMRKMGRVRSGGPHATSRPSRRRDLEPMGSRLASALNNKTGTKRSAWSLSYCSMRKMGLEPTRLQ